VTTESKRRAYRQTVVAAHKATNKSTAVGGAAKKPTNRGPSTRVVHAKKIFENSRWTVCFGELRKPAKVGRAKVGRPPKDEPVPLFKLIGEKLPYASLKEVRAHVRAQLDGKAANGVYVAHDSMGCPRYIGRGKIFQRLEARQRAQVLELEYFSFYVVEKKWHEREVETLLIRCAGFLLEFNEKKKRVGIAPGNVRDYEPGTLFYERHYRRGRQSSKKSAT
jgi:hypothetical protein